MGRVRWNIASACAAGWAVFGSAPSYATCPDVAPELGAIERSITEDFKLDARKDLASLAKALICSDDERPPREVLARVLAAQAALSLLSDEDYRAALVALASAKREDPTYQPTAYGAILATWWRLASGREVAEVDWPEGYDSTLDRWWRDVRANPAPVPVAFRNVGCRWIAMNGELVAKGGVIVTDGPLTRPPGMYLVQAGGGGTADYGELVWVDGRAPIRLHDTAFEVCDPIGVVFKNTRKREVFVDGEPIADLATPHPLQPGEYTIEARKAGSSDPDFSAILNLSPLDETPTVVPLTSLASRRRTLLSSGAGLGAAAIASYGASWIAQWAYTRPEIGQRDLELGIVQHGIVVGSGGLLAASSACLVAGFSTKREHPWELPTTK